MSDRTQRITRSAAELFAAHGYHGTSVGAIAKKAGVSPGLVFWHFDSKDQLFSSVAAEVGAVWVQTVLAAGANSTGIDAIVAMIRAREDIVAQQPHLVRFLATLLGQAPTLEIELWPTLASLLQPVEQRMSECLQHAAANGELASGIEPQHLSRVIMTALLGALQLWALDPANDISDADESLVATLLALRRSTPRSARVRHLPSSAGTTNHGQEE